MEIKSIGMLLFENVELLDFAGPLEVFGAANYVSDDELYSIETVAPTKQIQISKSLLSVNVDQILDGQSYDLFLIPGGFGTRPIVKNEALLALIKQTIDKSKIIASICTGSLILAKLGLLGGKEVCSHHLSYDILQKLDPTVSINKEARYMDNGKSLMRFLILSDMFSLESWLIHDKEPEIMPAVYEFFNYLGQSKNHNFVCYIHHKTIRKTITFENGSVIQIIPVPIRFHYPRKFFSLFKMYAIAQKELKQSSYDIIYGLSIYSVIAARLGKSYDVFSVSRIFGSLVNNLLVKKEHIKLYSRYLFQYLELKYPADLIICTEDGTKFDTALHKINPSKNVNMLFNGINSDMRQSLLQLPIINQIDSNQIINFYSIGRLTHWKRHDLAIKTIHQLKEKFNVSVRLTILGQGEHYESLSTLIARLHLVDDVIIQAPIPHHKIPEFLRAQHVGLFLYDISNMGNAFWESCLSGRYIVTRKNGKISSLFIDDRVNMIDSEDPYLIAKHIYDQLGIRLEKDIRFIRNTINETIPSWEDRFKNELMIIESKLSEYRLARN